MKKGLKRTIAGALILLIGIIVPVTGMVRGMVKLTTTDSQPFVVPGKVEVQADAPGDYYLWNDYRIRHEGKTYSSSMFLPDGTTITVTDDQGEELYLEENASISLNNMDHYKNSIGFVTLDKAGTYTIHVEGFEEERVFSWSPFDAMEFVTSLFKGIAFAAVFGLIGLGITIWGVIVLCKNDKKTPA